MAEQAKLLNLIEQIEHTNSVLEKHRLTSLLREATLVLLRATLTKGDTDHE
jgi:hypothetical protein